MKVLVVDDSRAMRTMLRNIMGELGFEVVEAGNGREGVERLTETKDVALCLVDWNMPEMDGLEFVKTVRQNRTWAGVKIMMVSAENDMAKVARALMVGADEYAMKPLTRDAIIAKLEMLGIATTAV
jgi:two-component system, chemotaxis family, chemotaxis protein CheY